MNLIKKLKASLKAVKDIEIEVDGDTEVKRKAMIKVISYWIITLKFSYFRFSKIASNSSYSESVSLFNSLDCFKD